MHFDPSPSLRTACVLLTLLWAASAQGQTQEAVFSSKSLTPEMAWKAAKAAQDDCRKRSFQVTVAVVDRAGITQVLLRDRYAGPHTVEVAADKAWTAAAFRLSTSELAQETQAGKIMSGLRGIHRFMAAAGGLPVSGAGAALGGIGVSGAPGGASDEACAQAGLKAITDAIDFE